MDDHRSYSMQDLLDDAIRQEMIDGYVKADGWVQIFVGDHPINLSEGQVIPFLRGMLCEIRRHAQVRR